MSQSSSSPLIDSHCHLDFARITEASCESEPIAALWQRCQAQGIERLIIPGVSPRQWLKAKRLASQLPGVYWAAGLHPWRLAQQAPSIEQLAQQLAEQAVEPRCVAIGECGLDGAIDTPLNEQMAFFEAQLQVAVELSLPVIVHVRRSHPELQALLKRYRPRRGGVIHGFNGSTELGLSYWRLGFRLGIGGSITYPRASKTRRAASELPLEALLLETDAPDMPLHGLQGQPNSPLQLPRVAEQLAQLRGTRYADIARQTSDNCRLLFDLPE
jgi:TatD DNase family protein